MTGQHLFMRCWNEQNNAGTWTAAVTDGIADKNTIRSEIEPRCNIDESFAQRSMLNHSGNNVLRIYSTENASVVVSRTYWENDRLTESAGRKGAYTFSYIITGNDAAEFCSDFSGAFDEECFEPYESVIQRVKQSGSLQVTINPQYDIFHHSQKLPDLGIFSRCGFERDTFFKLMDGVYYALEHDSKLAVLLPTAIRKAWIEKGDNTAERLMMAILALLPPYTRKQIGMVSHWSCAVKDNMLRNIHIVFVHPEKPEDMSELRKNGVQILDLDSGRYTSVNSSASLKYYNFLWSNLNTPVEIERLWAYAESKCGNVLKLLPKTVLPLESVYHIKMAEDDGCSSTTVCKEAYIQASAIFAGAGNALSNIDSILTACLKRLIERNTTADTPLINAILRFVELDESETEHQVLEYNILFFLINKDKASAQTVDILGDEIKKADRNASEYYLAYLDQLKKKEVTSISTQTVAFVAKLFGILSTDKELMGTKLHEETVHCLTEWSKAFQDAEMWGKLAPIVEIYTTYLKQNGKNANTVLNAYKVLVGMSTDAKGEFLSQCEDALIKEERRLYQNPRLAADSGETRFHLLCEALSLRFPLSNQYSIDVLDKAFQRLYRLCAFGNDDESVKLADAFAKQLKTIEKDNKQFNDDALILKSQDCAFADMHSAGTLWNDQGIQKCCIRCEERIQHRFKEYSPNSKRIAFLLDTFGDLDSQSCIILANYLKRMSKEQRNTLFEQLRDKKQCDRFWVYTFFDEGLSEFQEEMDPFIAKSSGARLQLLAESQFSVGNDYQSNKLIGTFSDWYKKNLEARLNLSTDFLSRLKTINDEYSEINRVQYDFNGIKKEAHIILNQIAASEINTQSPQQLARLPKKAISTINGIAFEKCSFGAINNAAEIRTIAELDAINEKDLVRRLDLFIYNEQLNKTIICERLNYYIRYYREDPKDLTKAWQCELFRALLDDNNRSFVHNLRSGEMSSKYIAMNSTSHAALILDMMRWVDYAGSRYRKRVQHEGAEALTQIASAFSSPEIQSKYLLLNNLSQEDRRLIARKTRPYGANLENEWDGFTFHTILLCVIGGIIAVGIMIGVFLLLHLANRASTLIAAIVGIVIFIILLLLVILLKQIDGSNNKQAEWGRY